MSNKIVEILRSKFLELQSAARVRRDRIEAAYKEQNSNIPPTQDRNGRYHAPCDGYMFPCELLGRVEYRGSYDDFVFGAGEYLPVPITEEDDYLGGYGSVFPLDYKGRVKSVVSKIEELRAVDRELGLQVSHGKVWEQDGQKIAIAYVSGIRAMVNAALAELALPENAREHEPEVYLQAGRQHVTGEVVYVKVEEGYHGFTRKMLVKTPQGHKLWGSLPGCLDFDYRGWISFSADFEPGKNGMTWFKRPTKVSIDVTSLSG
jgi:hypothetical protein